jgi:hypothetical protein
MNESSRSISRVNEEKKTEESREQQWQAMMHPQLLEGLKEKSQVKTTEKEKELGHAP